MFLTQKDYQRFSWYYFKVCISNRWHVSCVYLVPVATPPPPTGTLSDDSLADVLPISSVTKKISIPNEPKKMKDKVASGKFCI